MKDSAPYHYAFWVKCAIYTVLLGLLYFSTIEWLVTEDWHREDFNYAFMIPFVVLYLVWEKRGDLVLISLRPSWLGVLAFGLGICLFWLGELAGEFFIQYFSLWLLILGLCWLERGWQTIRTLSFAFVMLLTLFPPPNFIYTKISFYLKLISSKLGVDMIRLYGMTAYREGNVIDLGFTQLQVVDACSGLRYLIPLIVLALLLVYFFKAPLWKRAVVLISSIPLSILTNSLRIALTGILYQTFGPAVAEGFFHGFSGWFIFMFSLGVLLLEMWMLGRIGKSRMEHESGKEDSVQSENQPPKNKSTRKPLVLAQSVVAMVVLGVSLGLSQGVEFREKIPAPKPLEQFPMELWNWQGNKQTMEQRFIDSLDLSDYVIVDYRDPYGKTVNLYVAYYESQRKGESIHSPATCLPGGGWVLKKSGTAQLAISSSDTFSIPVNRAIMQKGELRQLVYYWFPQRGRVLTNAYELKLFAFWDALTKQRTDGALVRVITPIYPLEELQKAEERMENFLSKAIPVLRHFIPGRTLEKQRKGEGTR